MKLSNIISSCEILQNIAKDILKCIFKNNTWRETSVTLYSDIWFLLCVSVVFLKEIILKFPEYKLLNKMSMSSCLTLLLLLSFKNFLRKTFFLS